jgi:hypothetical protein
LRLKCNFLSIRSFNYKYYVENKVLKCFPSNIYEEQMNKKRFSLLFTFLVLILINLLLNLVNIYKIDKSSLCSPNQPFSKNYSIMSASERLLYQLDHQHEMDDFILDFENFDNQNGTSKYIVPNIIHLIYLNSPNIKFYQAINIYSIFLNHKPDLIIIHCDNCSFWGYYWNEINSIVELRKLIRLNSLPKINTIFDKKFKFIQHRFYWLFIYSSFFRHFKLFRFFKIN